MKNKAYNLSVLFFGLYAVCGIISFLRPGQNLHYADLIGAVGAALTVFAFTSEKRYLSLVGFGVMVLKYLALVAPKMPEISQGLYSPMLSYFLLLGMASKIIMIFVWFAPGKAKTLGIVAAILSVISLDGTVLTNISVLHIAQMLLFPAGAVSLGLFCSQNAKPKERQREEFDI